MKIERIQNTKDNSLFTYPVDKISDISRETDQSSREEIIKNIEDLSLEERQYKTNPYAHAICNIRASIATNFKIITDDKPTESGLRNFFSSFVGQDVDYETGELAYKSFLFKQVLSACVQSEGLAMKRKMSDKYPLALSILHPSNWEWIRDKEEKIKINPKTGKPVGKKKVSGKGYVLYSEGREINTIPYEDLSILTFGSYADEKFGTSTVMVSYDSLKRLIDVEAASSSAIKKFGQPAVLAQKRKDQFGISRPFDEKSEEAINLQKKVDKLAEDGQKSIISGDDWDIRFLQSGGLLQSPSLMDPFIRSSTITSGIPEPLLGISKTFPHAAFRILTWFFEQTQGNILRRETEVIVRTQHLKWAFDEYGPEKTEPKYKIEYGTLIPMDLDVLSYVLGNLSTVRVQGRPIISWEEARGIVCRELGLPFDIDGFKPEPKEEWKPTRKIRR